jgi:uncharacterized membrane protein
MGANYEGAGLLFLTVALVGTVVAFAWIEKSEGEGKARRFCLYAANFDRVLTTVALHELSHGCNHSIKPHCLGLTGQLPVLKVEMITALTVCSTD